MVAQGCSGALGCWELCTAPIVGMHQGGTGLLGVLGSQVHDYSATNILCCCPLCITLLVPMCGSAPRIVEVTMCHMALAVGERLQCGGGEMMSWTWLAPPNATSGGAGGWDSGAA